MLETKFYFNEMKLVPIMSELDHGLRKGKNLCMCSAEPLAGGKEIVLLLGGKCPTHTMLRSEVLQSQCITGSLDHVQWGGSSTADTEREKTGYCLVINWTHLAIIICSANLLTLHVLNGSVFTEFTLNKCSVTIYNNVFSDFLSWASISSEKQWNKI